MRRKTGIVKGLSKTEYAAAYRRIYSEDLKKARRDWRKTHKELEDRNCGARQLAYRLCAKWLRENKLQLYKKIFHESKQRYKRI